MFEKINEFISTIGGGIGYFVSVVQQGASQALEMTAKRFLPFLCFIALLIGIINGSGLGSWLGNVLAPLAGSLPGLLLLSFICTIPIVSPVLAPGAVIAAIVGALIGEQIATGTIPATWALPALFAMDSQVGCDTLPLSIGMQDPSIEAMTAGIPAVLISRWITGPIATVIAYFASIGMY
ncbi:MAG: hypothetical protein ACOX21_08785 [Bacillota bacterium]|jgi:PTS system glucitol/sorbitol-specific IIB component|nr:PTS glucitol/sorbitol transporter subunit IIB [Bacillota bacterium]HOC05985.1 hypothetical protein [Bacillota bacterium]HPZ22037.1 hypothetical protein [Bacillota bacterium]HQD20002.1 hypothetical protein [Bacillota bacterium]